MKVASNKSETKKRKRGNSQEIIPESPKKAKVHAQRKFAQGAAFNSPAITPIKDKIRSSVTTSSPGPMLTTKCPNTEDFLTFLCFRRTSILPPKLDFFKDAFTSEPEVSNQGKKRSDSARHKSKVETSGSISQKNTNKKSEKKNEHKKSQNQNSVQALKKKYQEQRLAKAKVTNVTKLAQKVKGKNMVSTRSAGFVKESKEVSINTIKETKNHSTRLRSGLMRIQTISKTKKVLGKVKFLRTGLRSGKLVKSDVESVKKSKETIVSSKKTDTDKKIKTDTVDSSPKKPSIRKLEGLSDFSSDDNEPLAIKKPRSLSQSRVPVNLTRKLKPFLKTRSKSVIKSESSYLTARPSRKTKEAAAIYMEMITKKLVSPEKSGEDDVSSVESFPELPNAKRNEQRETEIKAKALASKTIEPKQQPSDKSKENKITSLKKTERKLKNKDKNVKKIVSDKLKDKEGKERRRGIFKKRSNLVEVKKEDKKVLREEPYKGKNEEKCNEQERISISHRPSTRSRQLEESHLEIKKPEVKNKSPSRGNVLKKPKITIKESDEKLVNVAKKPGRKSKIVKSLVIPSKINATSSSSPHKKIQSPVLVKDTDETKKASRSGENENKVVSATKKRKKGTEIQILERETKTKKDKDIEKKEDDFDKKEKIIKQKEKENEMDEKKEGKKTTKEENIGSKRPTRKCSAADKIWIDIDGFTSDEEDFLERPNNTKTEAVGNKEKPEKLCEKKMNKKESKSKLDKAKEPEIEKNLDSNDNSEFSAKKTKSKVNEDNIAIPKSSGKKVAEWVKKPKETEKPDEKSNFEKGLVKDSKTQKEEKEKENLCENQKVTEFKTLTCEPDVPKESCRKRKIVSHPKSSENLEKLCADELKESKKAGGTLKKTKLVPTSNKDISETKKIEEERKKDLLSKRNFRGRRSKTEKEAEELESTRRKRPVRQCSTGDKRWIETDSDSFSFYETSDEESQTTKLNFNSKTENKVKVSPAEKVTEVILETQGPSLDNFSDSDEEPLRKKSLLIDDVVAKLTETKPEKFSDFTNTYDTKGNKIQKEVPDLHPLKKTIDEPKPKAEKTTLISSVVFNAPLSHAFYFPTVNKFSPTQAKTPAPDINKFVGVPTVPEIRQTDPPKMSSSSWKGNFGYDQNPSTSLPSRIDMILHTLKRDKPCEEKSPYQSQVNLNTTNIPYQPLPQPQHTQINQTTCTYQIKTVTFPPPREPISTHGLDLLSEVALPDTPKEKMNSRTERIEKWLNDSLEAEKKKHVLNVEETEGRKKLTSVLLEKSKAELPSDSGSLVKPSISSHTETQKFAQLELLESQKLLKRNLFATEQNQSQISRAERQSPTPKKTLTSVQDLLKLQKERKDSGKPAADNSPHLKNCKCNNCIVKKGWFKNKPLPKPDPQKLPQSDEYSDSSKPFESLTKAFTKMTGEGENSKMSASVAPMVAMTASSPPFKSSSDLSHPLVSKESSERKGLFQQKKSFLERMKERERKEAAATKANANAFSPNNESSVYAFEPEPEKSIGINEPFRSKIRDSRNSSSSTSRSEEDALKICEDESSTVSLGTQVENTRGEAHKGPLKSSQSASIAVQVNLDSETVTETECLPDAQDGKSIEISTQTEVPEEDSDSPMFYIPLQQARAAGTPASSSQQLIQGVALKLGTEGPLGPNQRVIMKAKLVTKPPDTPSMKAVVMPQPKRIFDQKINNPPIGTVQPTTRKPPAEENSAKPLPSSSSCASKALRSATDGSSVSDSKSQETETEVVASKGNKCQNSGSTTGKSLAKSKEKTQSTSREKNEIGEDSHSPSSSSSKAKKFNKPKSTEPVINPSNSTWLPPAGTPSKLVEAPTFHPTEKEFQDPFEFFDRIRPAAEKFGLCRIVPPNNFKPDCKVSDDMRFTAYNQYIHRMFHRWGPNIKEMMAIKKYLATQSISLKQPPWVGGIEVDLPRLYQSVQNCGGLMKVMEKKKWHQVADMMKIPKAAQDRVTKLDDIYCKYLLPYDTLSHDERQKLFDEVEKDWENRQLSSAESQSEDEAEEENYIEECEECVVKGRNMALNQFYRIARNTMSMWFKSPEPPPKEVENEFWKQVRDRNHHICVHSGSIDSSGWGYGFPVAKNNTFSKHPWNLKVLTNNPGSVLRSLGPVMGVTVPTLHVGMLFTAFCWYRDPHGLPWIEYLHTGAPKIWYGISDDNSTVFQEALSKLLPRYIKNKTIWLPSDTAMIPPDLLVENGVSLCHTVQEPGQFILVFPRAFTSSICTGYLVSESVYFAQPSWLATAEQVFKDIQESCEPSMFSLEKLLFSIALDSRSSVEVLKQVLPMIWHVRQKEVDGRKTLFNLGLKCSERLPSKELGSKKKKGRWAQEDDGDYECEVCRTNLYVSLVTNSHEEGVYCLQHAIDLLTQKRHQLKFCKLVYTFTQEEMNELVEKLEQRIENKSQKKLCGKLLMIAK